MIPAEVGDIDDDAIGIAEFLFVERRRRVTGGPPHEVFPAGILDLAFGFAQFIDMETDVVKPDKILAGGKYLMGRPKPTYP